jgi:hypothetical protein
MIEGRRRQAGDGGGRCAIGPTLKHNAFPTKIEDEKRQEVLPLKPPPYRPPKSFSRAPSAPFLLVPPSAIASPPPPPLSLPPLSFCVTDARTTTTPRPRPRRLGISLPPFPRGRPPPAAGDFFPFSRAEVCAEISSFLPPRLLPLRSVFLFYGPTP